MVVRVYVGYGGRTPKPLEVRICEVKELGVELMSLFLLHGSIPFTIAFKKGERNSECIIVLRKQDRRNDE